MNLTVRISLLCFSTALLTACGGPARFDRMGGGDWPVQKSSGTGGYYQDDGPSASTPGNLDGVPDAVPRWEPVHRGALKPYEVLGKRYVPNTRHQPYRERGIASWYGKKFHGNTTANGERYDMFAMSAAHTTLVLPSYVRVTNTANGRSVVVRVNDRGPFHSGRIIDLSYAAAHKLDLISRGSGEVMVEAILPGDGATTSYAVAGAPQTPSTRLPALPAGSNGQAVTDNASPGYYVQLGAFGNPDNAIGLRSQLGRDLDWLDQPISIHYGGGVHRVQVGPYAQRVDAEQIASRIGDALGLTPAIAIR